MTCFGWQARHEPPFPDRDASFRDAIILLSAADDLDAAAGKGGELNALLLSKDDYFKEIREFTTQSGSSIHIVDDVAAALNRVSEQLETAIVKYWGNERDDVQQRLAADTESIENFLVANLEVPAQQIFLPQVIEVRALRLGAITKVNVPLPFNRPEDGNVEISFEAAVVLEEVVDVTLSSSPPPAALRVGQSSKDVQVEGPGFSWQTRREDRIVEETAVTEATATLQGGVYPTFQYKSARLSGSAGMPHHVSALHLTRMLLRTYQVGQARQAARRPSPARPSAVLTLTRPRASTDRPAFATASERP